MIHESLPQTMTKEALAAWVTENSKENIMHETQLDLGDDEIKEHEHKLSTAQRKILELKDLLKSFTKTLKKGTPADENGDGLTAVDVTIPPTAGLDNLEANVRFHSDILEKGFRIDEKWLYLIPWPESAMMIAVDIEGQEYPEKSRTMGEFEETQAAKLFRKDDVTTEFPDRHIDDMVAAGTEVPIAEVATEKPKQKKKKERKTADTELFVEEESVLQEPTTEDSSEESFI